MNRKTFVFAGLILALLLAPSLALGNAEIIIVNANAPGVGFNDPTPAAPVGGNPGTTLGQQRINVFLKAAEIWGEKLDSNVPIFVIAQFVPLAPGVLGSASTTFIFSDFVGVGAFPGAEFPATWYHSALADKRAGEDLNPGFADIQTNFSTNFVFYLGFDNNEGALSDLLPVVLHELGHGLGFANFVNEATGAENSGLDDIYSHFTLDADTGLHWTVMTNAERQASAINGRDVVWDGATVTSNVPGVLSLGVPQLIVNSPPAIAGGYAAGTAAFGAPLTAAGVTASVALVNDGVAPTSDACTALPAGSLTGLIGLADRGTCTFVVKVKIMQDAGALAALIADNVADDPPAGLGGVDPAITIPSVRITLATGNAIKANLGGGVNATLGLNMALRAGANAQGFAQLWAVNPVALGSSISHWDIIAFPNQLMEPAINPDLTNSVEPPLDLTLPLMRDVGWFPDADLDGIANDGSDQCPESDLAPTVVIDGCDSGVPNTLLESGCTITDLVMNCAAGAGNHGQFVSCVSHMLNDLKKKGIITGAQKGAIQSCAAQADIP